MKRMLIKLASAAMLLSPVQVLAEETQTISVLQKIQDLFNQEKEQGFAETLGIKIYVNTMSTYRTKYFKNGLEGMESVFTDLCNEYNVDPDLALAVCLNETSMGTTKECKENYNFGIPDTENNPVVFKDCTEGMTAFIKYLALSPEEVFSTSENLVEMNLSSESESKTDEKKSETKETTINSAEQIAFKYKEVGFTDNIKKLIKTIQESETEQNA